MKIKPLPRNIAVAALIGAAIFGITKYTDKGDTQPPQQVAAGTEEPQQAPSPQEPVYTAPAPERSPNLSHPSPAPGTPPELSAGEKLDGTGIASGQKTGTNWPMVEDVRKACSTDSNPIRNVISDGSLDNLYKIHGDKNTQFGIVQEDVLAYQQNIDPNMMKRVVAVFPFFSVEIHLVASRASSGVIRTLEDLRGRRVVEGPHGSGTWVTVQIIKQLTGIEWTPLTLSQKDGLAAVESGQADAEFIVAGRPITVLKAAQEVRLVPITHPRLASYGFYTPTLLPTGSYPWQAQPVQTYKLNNVLATFAYKNQYQKEIGDLVSCITRSVPRLQADGHEKWKDVEPLDLERVKWPVHPAALAAVRRERRR